MKFRTRISAWTAFAGAVSLALVGAAFLLAKDKHEDLWFEVGKAGIQLAVLTIIGGLVAAALRLADSMRDERRKLNDYRISVMRQVVTAYNQIKAARRILRAFGFRAPRDGTLRESQVTEFITQLKALNAAQLTLEGITRELFVCGDAFRQSKEMLTAVGAVESYVSKIIKDWERSAGQIDVAADVSVITSLESLQQFLSETDRSFEAGAAKHMDFLEDCIRSELLPAVAPQILT